MGSREALGITYISMVSSITFKFHHEPFKNRYSSKWNFVEAFTHFGGFEPEISGAFDL